MPGPSGHFVWNTHPARPWSRPMAALCGQLCMTTVRGARHGLAGPPRELAVHSSNSTLHTQTPVLASEPQATDPSTLPSPSLSLLGSPWPHWWVFTGFLLSLSCLLADGLPRSREVLTVPGLTAHYKQTSLPGAFLWPLLCGPPRCLSAWGLFLPCPHSSLLVG